MIVVDSSVWIAHLRNELTPAVAWLRNVENAIDIAVGDLVLMEVLRGARDDRHAGELQGYLRQFRPVTLMSPARAVSAARNYRNLRSLGSTPRKAIDVIIATFCLERGCQLLHQDRDFDPFEQHLGLEVLRPH